MQLRFPPPLKTLHDHELCGNSPHNDGKYERGRPTPRRLVRSLRVSLPPLTGATCDAAGRARRDFCFFLRFSRDTVPLYGMGLLLYRAASPVPLESLSATAKNPSGFSGTLSFFFRRHILFVACEFPFVSNSLQYCAGSLLFCRIPPSKMQVTATRSILSIPSSSLLLFQ